MHFAPFVLALAALLVNPVLAQAPAKSNEAVVFPALKAEDLNEKPYALPKDLPAPHTVLIVAFKREQQKDVDTWINGLDLKGEGAKAYNWLELPVLEDYGSWFKWFVDNGMRRGIKSEFSREKVVTVYTDKATFRKQVGIASEEQIHTLVVTPEGKVLLHITGNYTPEKAASLSAFKSRTVQP